MSRKEELTKMIYSLEKQADMFERELIQKTELREGAIRLSWKYKQELAVLDKENDQ